ncbi:MAG: hypothetical protein F4Y03_07770, partial [Alphaproteobacteria bacterium]|nr:hypothetical protein [Alphaproteobacteria bacterium]
MADPNRSPPLDLQAFHRVRKLCLQGLSIPDIARSMGRSKAQIDKAVRFMGGVATIRKGIETMPDASNFSGGGDPAEEILGYTRHRASAVWPDLGEDEYTALRDNIEAQGQDHPILATPDKRVIDGWHRLLACAELDLKPVTTVAHFSEEEIARKVIGAHTGRRHMTQIDIARLTIETMKACGMEHAAKGDRRNPEQRGQPDPSAPKVITRETVAKDAGVSESTARRAIREDKRKSGLLPPRDAGTGTPPAEPSGGPEPEGGAAPAPDPGKPASEENQAAPPAEAPAPPARHAWARAGTAG